MQAAPSPFYALLRNVGPLPHGGRVLFFPPDFTACGR